MDRITDAQQALDLVNRPGIRALLAAQSIYPRASADGPQELSPDVESVESSRSDASAAVGETDEELTWKPLPDFDEEFNIISDKGAENPDEFPDNPDDFPEISEDEETDKEIRAILAGSDTRGDKSDTADSEKSESKWEELKPPLKDV